jgi:hypothetical protein
MNMENSVGVATEAHFTTKDIMVLTASVQELFALVCCRHWAKVAARY